MQPDGTESFSMVTVARFRDREQAGEFCAIAAECGVATRASDSRRFSGSGSFDATLGGADSLEGCSIQVKTEDVAVLKAHLEAHMEFDPLDPMHTADRAELLAMVGGPLNGNLCEQIIAARILANLPPATIGEILPGAVDAHLAADRRMARWLGATGLLFTAVYLVILLNGLGFSPYPDSSYGHDQRHPGFGHYVPFEGDAIANNVRPFLIMLVPLGTGAALIFSTRQLRDGTSRRMFPLFWRITGHLLFWLPVCFIAALLCLIFQYGATRAKGDHRTLSRDSGGKPSRIHL